MYSDIANVFLAATFVLAVPTVLFYLKASKQKNEIEETIDMCISYLFVGGLIACAVASVVFKILGEV